MFSFGASSTLAPPPGGPSFNFGAPPATGSTGFSFGAAAPTFTFGAPAPAACGPSQFGAAPGLPAIAQPVTGLPFPKETKFADLPPELAANMESIERTLRKAAEQSAALATLSFASTSKLAADVGQFADRVAACEAANETCRGQLLAAKALLNQYWRYGESVARMIISSRQTTPDGQVRWVPVLAPADTFLLEDMVLRLESQSAELVSVASVLRRQLDQLNMSSSYSSDILRTSLKHQHDLFIGLAGKVADLEEQVERLRTDYRHFILKYRNDTRDPFAPRASSGGAVQQSADGARREGAAGARLPTASLPPPVLTMGTGAGGGTGITGFVPPPPPPPAPLFGAGMAAPKRASISGPPSGGGGFNPFLLQTPR